ncbi:MAG TPA: DUF58 domain-containing protein [Planctomycetota bacterium]|nr:DUF58 domain-containing protein [Planctomycetota bacterium]
MEGTVAGLHRSPYRGVSVEFAQHRQYVPGDDLRFLDWKVFARSDRYTVKEFEEETNLTAHVFLDASGSMGFTSVSSAPGEPPITKFRYASWVAAALAHLALRQRDAVSLVVFDEKVRNVVPAGSGRQHLDAMIRAIEAATPSASTTTAKALFESVGAIHRRGLVIVVSDLLGDATEALRALDLLRARGHDVIVLRVLDPAEIHFEYDRMTRFEDLEGPSHLLVDPRALREAYLEEFRVHDERLRRGCVADRIDLERLTTETPLDVGLVAYLGARAARAHARA